MRRRVGLGTIQQQQVAVEKYKGKGTDIQECQLGFMIKQMDVFRQKLEEFSIKHNQDIKKNTQFRKYFQEMCAAIGVDPLASGKGFWSVLGIGDFYYEIAVKVVEVCLALNEKTGGLIELDELRYRLVTARGVSSLSQEISKDDILTAAKKLSLFGNGFAVHNLGREKYIIQSIPGELNMEQANILNLASQTEKGYVTLSMLMDKLKWSKYRAKQSLDAIVREGFCWVDHQSTELAYWFPSLFPKRVL